MANDAEYNSLVNQKRDAQSEYAACEKRIQNCDYLLGRLRPVKEAISELKDAFKDTKKLDKDLSKEKLDWKGSTYDDFINKMDTLKNANDTYYKNSLDRILDSINDEITRIENQRMEECGMLGRLGSWINSLSNKIENFFN